MPSEDVQVQERIGHLLLGWRCSWRTRVGGSGCGPLWCCRTRGCPAWRVVEQRCEQRVRVRGRARGGGRSRRSRHGRCSRCCCCSRRGCDSDSNLSWLGDGCIPSLRGRECLALRLGEVELAVDHLLGREALVEAGNDDGGRSDDAGKHEGEPDAANTVVLVRSVEADSEPARAVWRSRSGVRCGHFHRHRGDGAERDRDQPHRGAHQ
mmetsp:Transcript_173/g.691  ORF Transcript_173/g.691 Transcript_173/m.691 type:complete len:208 (-) Transcript_173:18-641(-)